MINYLASLTDNGKLIYTTPPVTLNNAKIPNDSQPNFLFRHAITSFFPEIKQNPGLTSVFNKSHNSFFAGLTLLFEHLKIFSKNLSESHEGTSGFRQFCVLSRVMFLRILRARIPIVIQFIHHIMVGLCFGKLIYKILYKKVIENNLFNFSYPGLLFYNLGNQGSHMFAHLKFCISAILMIAYTQVTIPVLTCKY